ncbi:FAD-binding oxidoreductase [Actinoplanes siamensis]|uniref:FAD-linked oxidase n=1 Tax=Actinoplanes siamensis TaxID=1223317 RepID=A0A919N9W4_9ACTN|nr:FAD-dependent oxidoreductase [Actinoplanes siamensis]GIF07038.1 FAD-linked oxidase [Actinoplanes siamensis]
MTSVNHQRAAAFPPGAPGYRAATEVFNLAAVPCPAAAVTTHTIEQVRQALRYARGEGLGVRVHSTGHASAGVRPVDGGLLVRTALRGGVSVDPATGAVRIPAGTRWGEVVAATSPHGVTVAHGSSPTVGAVGYLLGGGMSFYGRMVGLAANTIRAIDLVTADGEMLHVTADTDPELFWALRGGGGGFGVVTAVEVGVVPVRHVHTGSAWWPAVHAERLVRIWRDWAGQAPRTATTSLRVMNLPPVPGGPPQLSAGVMVSVDGAVVCDDDPSASVARELLGPLRSVAEPVLDTWATTDVSGVLHAHMDPDRPLPVIGDHMLLRELSDDGIGRLLEVLGEGSGSPLIAAGLRQLGGAFAVPAPGGGALSHLEGAYSYAGSGVPMGGVTPQALREHCARVRAALRPWDTGRTVPSFVESFDQPQGHLEAAAVARADRVRLRVDPDGLFRGDIAPHATALA